MDTFLSWARPAILPDELMSRATGPNVHHNYWQSDRGEPDRTRGAAAELFLIDDGLAREAVFVPGAIASSVQLTPYRTARMATTADLFQDKSVSMAQQP